MFYPVIPFQASLICNLLGKDAGCLYLRQYDQFHNFPGMK